MIIIRRSKEGGANSVVGVYEKGLIGGIGLFDNDSRSGGRGQNGGRPVSITSMTEKGASLQIQDNYQQ